jgi:hypothetical protein
MDTKELIAKAIAEGHITMYDDFLQTEQAQEYALTPEEAKEYYSHNTNKEDRS